ncbi:hypothetical protein CBS101457_003069 [Exobasidium rhododendri]|nr:hypothetical protein CBS101457_003069 [Exobasidium rhododendri]
MFHIKTGSLHHLENIGDEEAEALIAFRHELPKDFDFAASCGAFTDAVLGNTYDVESSAFAKIPRNTQSKYVVERKGKPTIPDTAYMPNSHKFDLDEIRNGVKLDIGFAKQAKSQYWPVLTDMAMYSLGVEVVGMREVHWHPFTAEMGFVHKGKARMTVMDPDGSVDTYVLNKGDVYFIPAAYPHQIEVLGDEDIHFLIFFDNAMPGDVGFRTSTTAFSREVLASTFEIPIEDVPDFPFVTKDPLIVGRLNPLDPVEE